MADRKRQIEELLVDLSSLKRMVAAKNVHGSNMPAVTPSQWNVLMFIEQEGMTSVKSIASALRISSSAATQLVDGLVKKGYVLRTIDANDRRAVSLTLSKKLKSSIAAMKRRTVRRFSTLFEALNDAEFREYCTLSKKIISAGKNGRVPAKR